MLDVFFTPILPIISTKRQHGAVPSRPRARRISIPQRDPIPLHHLRHHPRPTQKTLFFKPHAFSQRNRRPVLGMRCPLHAPETEPATLGWCAGQLEAVVQDKSDGIGGHVGASEFREYEDPGDLCVQVRGGRADQPYHACECVSACFIDDGEEDVGWAEAYEGFDLR